MARARIAIVQWGNKLLEKNDLGFPIVMWLVSRAFIWTAMLIIAPHIPAPTYGVVPKFGWEVFDAWDSLHYQTIVTSGYEFQNDGERHNLAFFPLFPLTISFLMRLGLRFEASGILVNNFTFLIALCCLYSWLKQNYGTSSAQWGTAFISWCPMSMFTGIIYTEGLYLCLSTAALRAFDQKSYKWTAFWGAMATATRPTGMALIPAFILASIKESRPILAYIAGLCTSLGLVLFSFYSALVFNDPLAFILAQKGWRPSLGFDWPGWLNMVLQIPLGSNWYYGWIVNSQGGLRDPLHPIVFSVVVIIASCLWLARKNINHWMFYGTYASVVLILIISSELFIYNLLNLLMFFGGGWLLWHLRKQLTSVTMFYGFCGISLLLAAGSPMSLGRLAYGIIPLNVGIGVLLSQNPRYGYLAMGLFMTVLAKMSIGFAQRLWVG